MANGMGSLYVGKSGLTMAQTAINTTANNLANVNTKGYVREQVLFSDVSYNTISGPRMSKETGQSVNMMQNGLGVNIGDVVHSRDLFLDKYYRTEAGRQSFYNTLYDTNLEIETLVQEMDGKAFQEVIQDMAQAIAELQKDPGSSVNQNLMVQKATLFLERSNALYESLQEYQLNMNEQITDSVNEINDIGKQIDILNKKIQQVEAAQVETAMELRDERDVLLDRLGGLANISFAEEANGMVKVKLEGIDFIDDMKCHELDVRVDKTTKFATPIWKELSDMDKEDYVDVFDYSVDISTEMNTDIGKLKSLVMARGTEVADFLDINDNYYIDAATFVDTTGLSSVATIEAQVDNLVRQVVTTINDILSPTTSMGDLQLIPDTGSITGTDKEGNKVVLTSNTKIWDYTVGTVGADDKGPGEELFSRKAHDRYKEVTLDDGTIYYVLNEEDLGAVEYDDEGNAIPKDDSTYYNLINLEVNPTLIADETKLPLYNQNGEVSYDIAAKLATAWGESNIPLTPGGTKLSFNAFYDNMVGQLASNGSVFKSVSDTLTSSVTSIVTQRESVIGVSSDEELGNLIKYQSAYNAASRFITTIDEMIEHLITQLGS